MAKRNFDTRMFQVEISESYLPAGLSICKRLP
jgi:hypothetical protein